MELVVEDKELRQWGVRMRVTIPGSVLKPIAGVGRVQFQNGATVLNWDQARAAYLSGDCLMADDEAFLPGGPCADIEVGDLAKPPPGTAKEKRSIEV